MTMLHFWAVWIGVAAVGLPVLVHLLTRPRPVRMPLSTLRFVREAIRQRRSRHRLRDWLILCLRTAAVLLLAWAMTRPFLGPQSLISEQPVGDTLRVVVLDASQSMAATEHGIRVIERARTIAAGHLRYRPGLWADLIVAGAVPRAAFDQPSTNFDALRDELARCQALPERANAARAIDLAARLLAPASPEDARRRELVLVSDFQRHNWASVDFSVLPKGTQIQLESVAPAETPENLAILSAVCRVQSAQGQSARLAVEVGNFSRSARKVEVEVALGEVAHRLSGTCPAGRSTVLSEQIELRGLGWKSGEAKLVGVDDALAADNVRPLVAEARPLPVYALITRQPIAQRPSSSHYLECALAPERRPSEQSAARNAAPLAGRGATAGRDRATVLRLDPAALSAAELAPAQLILLDHPGKLSEETIALLAGLLRRGRPMLYVAGELIDAVNLKRLCEAAGSGLSMPVEFTPVADGRLRRNLVLGAVRADSPPFAVFGDRLEVLRSHLRFAGGLHSRPLPGAMERDLLAAYHDGSACLVLTSSEAGTLAVLNADLGASNLPKTAAFVPLVGELVQRMLAGDRARPAAFCGESLVASLPSEAGAAAGLRVVAPPAAEQQSGDLGELVDEGVGVVWRWQRPSTPGVFRVQRGTDTVYSLALEVPPEESRLDYLSAGQFQERLAAGHDLFYRSAAAESKARDDLWAWLLAACVVCLLSELTALVAFRT